MKKNVYTYNREELINQPKIPLIVMDTNEDIFKSMAEEMIAEIERKNALNETTVFITPVGPVGHYPYFVDKVNAERINLANVWLISMDEYLDDDLAAIDPSDSLSFRGFMEREVYAKIDDDLLMPVKQRIFPDPEQLHVIPALIEKLGGVDIAFGGVGINGHVAFNEPQPELSTTGFKNLSTRIQEIAEATRIANAIGGLNGAIEILPKYCVTVGMKEIYQAKKVRLGVFRDWHRAVIRRAAHGEKSAAFPVSLLQDHPDVNIKLSEFVAKLDN